MDAQEPTVLTTPVPTHVPTPVPSPVPTADTFKENIGATSIERPDLSVNGVDDRKQAPSKPANMQARRQALKLLNENARLPENYLLAPDSDSDSIVGPKTVVPVSTAASVRSSQQKKADKEDETEVVDGPNSSKRTTRATLREGSGKRSKQEDIVNSTIW